MTFEQTGVNNAGYPIYTRKKEGSAEQAGMSRRKFLLGASAAAGAAAGYGVIQSGVNNERILDEQTELPERDSINKEHAVEVQEAAPKSEAFEAQRLGCQKWWELRYDQVLFVDRQGVPVGDPVPFENFVVKRTRTGKNGQPEEFDYLLSPGKRDANGLLADNIAGEWLRYVKARHARRYGVDADMLRQRNITEEFEKAMQEEDEPELRESITDMLAGGNGVETMCDLVRYYGMNTDKKVRGDEQERTRAQYLQEEIMFHNRVPQVVQDQLRHFIVGLAAQESRFNAGLPKNSATAEGVLQLTDAVRKEHGYPPQKRLSFVQEVDVAGRHFSNIYTRVRYWMKNEMVPQIRNGREVRKNGRVMYEKRDRSQTFSILRGLFPKGQAGEEQWQKYFLTPCMINAYNAGSLIIGSCLHAFVDAHSMEELRELSGEPPGYDLYTAFTHFARACEVNEFTRRYGDDAQAYFLSIAGATQALQ